MYAACAVVTVLAAAVYGAAAVANLIGHAYPKAEADRLGVPRSWMPVLGALLGAGALGLLGGLVVPGLGIAAASGLVLYFVGAFGAHVRAGDRRYGPWGCCFGLAVAALALRVVA
ncbi:DoxX family protein [Streptomyces sp. SID14478]|uniref:DoxX family protein n=1 Tax=Streptomyces sp. SID14478 TaxID=2706073 RepID=UPI0013E0BF0D|nr:DoxX family protein [Streptomyces sp. SID14478]NEB80354.1 DoxX family protein [Streptomyces sp. SID14478]